MTSEITNKITYQMADTFLNSRAQVAGRLTSGPIPSLTAFPQLGTVQDRLFAAITGISAGPDDPPPRTSPRTPPLAANQTSLIPFPTRSEAPAVPATCSTPSPSPPAWRRPPPHTPGGTPSPPPSSGGGTALVLVAELLGHARLDTVRSYTRPSADDRAKALDLLPIDR